MQLALEICKSALCRDVASLSACFGLGMCKCTPRQFGIALMWGHSKYPPTQAMPLKVIINHQLLWLHFFTRRGLRMDKCRRWGWLLMAALRQVHHVDVQNCWTFHHTLAGGYTLYPRVRDSTWPRWRAWTRNMWSFNLSHTLMHERMRPLQTLSPCRLPWKRDLTQKERKNTYKVPSI